MRMFNAGIQHEFTPTLTGEIQYIGQFGFGLFGERDVNAPPILADPAHAGFFYFGPRPDTRFTAIRTNENSRTSHYNGLLVSATKRFSHRMQFNASYTWSHALTSGEDFFGISEPGDPRNIRGELGPAFNDIRHAANFSVILDSGKLTQTNVARWFTNDLTLGFIGQLQSGRPWPISTGSAGFANGRFFGAGNETQQRPNVLPNGTLSTAGIASFDQSNALFSGSATSTAACQAGGFTAVQCASMVNTFLAPAGRSGLGAEDSLSGEIVDFQFVNGSLGRDAGRGSPLYRLDVSLQKTFHFPRAERVSLELRADAFNIFNHSNWQGFNGNDTLNALVLSTTPFATLNPGTCPAGGPPGSPLCGSNVPNSDFFTCGDPINGGCARPNGTLAGSNGKLLTLSMLQHGKVDKDLTNPTFGNIGNPTTDDLQRVFQLSFRVRF